MSRQGAALAVERAVQLAGTCAQSTRAGDPAAWVQSIFADAREQIAAMASVEGRDVADYATTLAVAIMTSDVLCVGQVGDTIAVVGHEGRYETVAPASRSEYVNETTFITEHGALEEIRITVKPGIEVDAVFLSTDGLRFKILGDLAACTPFTPFFEDVTEYVRSPEASTYAVRRFLAGLEDQSGDDKTLVAAVRTETPGPRERGQPERGTSGTPSAT